jgi:hypothetical protein
MLERRKKDKFPRGLTHRDVTIYSFLCTYPDVKLDVLVRDRLDVEPDRGYRVDGLAKLELVEDGGLAGGVQPQHEDAHLLVAKHLGQDLPHRGEEN